MLVLTYVFKARPTSAQHTQLDQILRDQRQLYNAALEERISAWRSGVSISMNDQTKSLTEIRSFDPAYGGVPYNVSKWTLKRLDDAMKAFFRRAKVRKVKAGFPRFRGVGRWASFGFHQKDGLRLKGQKLFFSGGLVGGLALKMHRQLPEGAAIKSAVFTKEGRHWRVALTVAVEAAAKHLHPGTSVGIDVGVEALATLSNGARIQNIRPRSQRSKELRRAARALARCKRGSRRRQKVRAKLAALQRKARNARTTHLHQVSARIANDFCLIAVEKLNLKNMTRSARGTLAEPGANVRQKAGLNRSLADAAPGRLISMLRYKAERAGGVLIEVDPRGTSQECYSCREVVPKKLSDRWHSCPCGAKLHRDHNSALVIEARGLAAHGAARGPGKPNVADRRMRALGKTELLAA